MYTHDAKLNAFGEWYKLNRILKTMDKNSPEYQALSKRCEALKQAFHDMFK